MIVFDTETTGLIGHASLPIEQQPEIIEFCAIKLDDRTLEEVKRLDFLIKPRILPLPPKITEITGLTADDLKDQPSFARRLPLIQDFFLGEGLCVAHNCAYDIGMMTLELKRLDRLTKFPWPTQQACTVEMNMDILGRRMKLGDLYEHCTGVKLVGAHRAINDVIGLCEIVRWMRKREKI